MEIKTTNELCAAFPDLVGQIENAAKDAARAEGIAAERKRIEGIEAIEAAIGDKALVKDAKYGENPLTAEQLAFKAMQAQAAIGANMVTKMETDATNSGAAKVVATPAAIEGDSKENEAAAINMIASFRPKKEG